MTAVDLYTYAADVLAVVDGDTLDLRVDLGFSIFRLERVRLRGANTPETRSGSPKERLAGARAKARAAAWVEAHGGRVLVRTEKDRADKYGRMLATVWPGPDVLTDDPLTRRSLNEMAVAVTAVRYELPRRRPHHRPPRRPRLLHRAGGEMSGEAGAPRIVKGYDDIHRKLQIAARRERIATAVLAGWCESYHACSVRSGEYYPKTMAQFAIAAADALIAELDKEEEA